MGSGVSAQNIEEIREDVVIAQLAMIYEQDPQKAELIVSKANRYIEKKRLSQQIKRSAENADKPEEPIDRRKVEEKVLEIMNIARTSPQEIVPLLEERLKRFEGTKLKARRKGHPNITTVEGEAAVKECIEYMSSAMPVPPLTLSTLLCEAAREHVVDIGTTGLATHVGTDGSTMQDRIERHGNWRDVIGENLDFTNREAEDIVVSLLVDDGVQARGHRNNIMNPKFKVAGIATHAHIKYRYVCVIDFAGDMGPKIERLMTEEKVEDATEYCPKVKAIFDSTPFEDVRQKVIEAFEMQRRVDIKYKPGELEVRIKLDGVSSTVLSGTWAVQAVPADESSVGARKELHSPKQGLSQAVVSIA